MVYMLFGIGNGAWLIHRMQKKYPNRIKVAVSLLNASNRDLSNHSQFTISYCK